MMCKTISFVYYLLGFERRGTFLRSMVSGFWRSRSSLLMVGLLLHLLLLLPLLLLVGSLIPCLRSRQDVVRVKTSLSSGPGVDLANLVFRKLVLLVTFFLLSFLCLQYREMYCLRDVLFESSYASMWDASILN